MMRIAQAGYGEVDGIFAAALARVAACEVIAYDVLVVNAAWANPPRAPAQRDHVTLAERIERALA